MKTIMKLLVILIMFFTLAIGQVPISVDSLDWPDPVVKEMAIDTVLLNANLHNFKFQYSYWNASYGDRMSGSRLSFYWDNDFDIIIGPVSLTIGGGAGINMRNKPIPEDRTLNEVIPMGNLLIHFNCRTTEFVVGKFEWYTSSNYFKPFSRQYDDTWDVYSKLSWQLPSFAKNWRLNFLYYGSESVSHNWEYAEGKIQLLYTWRQWSFGIEPYISGNWRNNIGWKTESRSNPGNIVISYRSGNQWFEISYGRYHKRSGFEPVISYENDEMNLSLSVGTKLF